MSGSHLQKFGLQSVWHGLVHWFFTKLSGDSHEQTGLRTTGIEPG